MSVMKNDNTTGGEPIKFKELADKLKAFSADSKISDSKELSDKEEDDLLSLIQGVLSSDSFNKAITEPSAPISDDEIYEEIVESYFVLIRELKIKSFNFFRFPDYDDPRLITVDGREYDLDDEFCHDDEDAAGALCAIDSLIPDLGVGERKALKKTEKLINIRNRENS